MASRYSKTAT